MIAKLITYGETRSEAIQLMKNAIANYQIKGIETTLPFGRFVCNHEAFNSGNIDTHFVKKYYTEKAIQESGERENKIAAKAALKIYLKEKKRLTTLDSHNKNWITNRRS